MKLPERQSPQRHQLSRYRAKTSKNEKSKPDQEDQQWRDKSYMVSQIVAGRATIPITWYLRLTDRSESISIACKREAEVRNSLVVALAVEDP